MSILPVCLWSHSPAAQRGQEDARRAMVETDHSEESTLQNRVNIWKRCFSVSQRRLTSLTHMSCLSSWIELPLISDKNITIGCRTFRRPLFIICSISLLFHYWTVYETVANVVSHSMAHGSKCRLFIGQYRVAYNKVIKTWRMLRLKPRAWRERGSWSECVIDQRGAVKWERDSYPSWRMDARFVFLQMYNLFLFIPFESSCSSLKS